MGSNISKQHPFIIIMDVPANEERGSMQGCREGRTCGGRRGEEGHGVGNVLDSGPNVGNGVDRGRVGIDNDDRDFFPSVAVSIATATRTRVNKNNGNGSQTRSDNDNVNCDMQTTTQQRIADRQSTWGCQWF